MDDEGIVLLFGLPRSSPSAWWSWRWRATPPATPCARSHSPCSPWGPEWRWRPCCRLGNPKKRATAVLLWNLTLFLYIYSHKNKVPHVFEPTLGNVFSQSASEILCTVGQRVQVWQFKLFLQSFLTGRSSIVWESESDITDFSGSSLSQRFNTRNPEEQRNAVDIPG